MADEDDPLGDAVKKCARTNRILPSICKKIKEIQKINKRFSFDPDLDTALEQLNALLALDQHFTSDEQVLEYIAQYRLILKTGFDALERFFKTLGEIETLTITEQNRLGQLSGSIAKDQNAIVNIAYT